MKARLAPFWVALASVGLVLLAGVYAAAYAALPSDGAVLDFRAPSSEAGLPIVVLREQAGGLRSGDRVLEIDGRPIEQLLRQTVGQPLTWTAPAPASSYTVLRVGQTLTVRQALGPLPAEAVLRQYWSVLAFMLYVELIGVVVFVRRPRLPAARQLLLLGSAILGSGSIYFLGVPLGAVRYGWMLGLWLVGSVLLYSFLLGALLHFTLLYPRISPLVQRPATLGLLYLLPWPPYLVALAFAWPQGGTLSSQLIVLAQSTNMMTAFMFPLALVAGVVSYRRYRTETERRQMRWILWAFCMTSVPWIVLDALPQAFGRPSLISPLLLGLLWCTIPTAIAISILREGLFDIDVVINRSLVYSALTLFLAGLYFGGVVLLQALFRLASGEGRSPLATVLTTLMIAALFSPLRARVQAFIDRRFYRRKYDAARTLAAFGATIRDEVDFDALSTRLVEVVDETMQPAFVGVWIRKDEG
jgi:hypothetical protein